MKNLKSLITICLFSILSMNISAKTFHTKVRTPLYGLEGKNSGVQINLNPNTRVEVLDISVVDVNGLVLASLYYNDNLYVGYIRKSDLTIVISAESDINYIDPESKRLFDIAYEEASKEFRQEPNPTFQKFPDRYYGLDEVDYDRFSSSICFKDLGFTPHVIGSSGYVEQLRRYKKCEKKKIIFIVSIFLVTLIIILAIFLYWKELKNLFRKVFIIRRSKGDKSKLTAKDNLENLKAQIETLHVLKKERIIDEIEFENRIKKIREKY